LDVHRRSANSPRESGNAFSLQDFDCCGARSIEPMEPTETDGDGISSGSATGPSATIREMADLPVPVNSPRIGECIYCGSTSDLSDEHAVPYAINGPWTLLEASCGDCRDITHRFERDLTRGLIPAMRAVFRMQTRRPRDRPKTLPLLLVVNGEDRFIQVPLNEFPVFLPVIEFLPPGVVAGRPPIPGIGPPVLNPRRLAGPTGPELIAKYPYAEYVGARMTFSPDDFGRTLAKIGFCAAVFALGIEPLRQSPIRKVILGRDPCIGHWVGSWTGDEQNPPKGLHRLKVLASGTDIHVVLRLFAQFRGHEYHVVLGPADAAFAASDAWPWK
jgi:hypothetical protein